MTDDSATLRAMAERAWLAKLREWGVFVDQYSPLGGAIIAARDASIAALLASQSSWAKEKAGLELLVDDTEAEARHHAQRAADLANEKAELERQLAEADAVIGWYYANYGGTPPEDRQPLSKAHGEALSRRATQIRHASRPVAEKE